MPSIRGGATKGPVQMLLWPWLRGYVSLIRTQSRILSALRLCAVRTAFRSPMTATPWFNVKNWRRYLPAQATAPLRSLADRVLVAGAREHDR
jgi:hypothetical protein